MTRDEFNSAMDKLCHAFDRKVSPERLRVYWEFFESFKPFDFIMAVNKAIKTCQYFPGISDLSGVLADVMNPAGKKIRCSHCANEDFESKMTLHYRGDVDKPIKVDQCFYLCPRCNEDRMDTAPRNIKPLTDTIGKREV
jgi:hypothetical protein